MIGCRQVPNSGAERFGGACPQFLPLGRDCGFGSRLESADGLLPADALPYGARKVLVTCSRQRKEGLTWI